MEEQYENIAGERFGIIIIGSLYVLILSLFSLGILLAPSAKAVYKQIFYHIKNGKLDAPLFKSLYQDTFKNVQLALKVSLLSILMAVALTSLFILAENIVVYVIIYFIIFETLLLLVVSLPMISVFKITTLKALFKTAFIIGHLHASGTVFSILLIIATIYYASTLAFPFNLLIIPPVFILYFTVTAFFYYKAFKDYETTLNQS